MKKHILLVAGCLAAAVAHAEESLEASAARLEAKVDTFLDSNDVLRCSMGASDVSIWDSKGPYENVGIVNGTFLQAMVARYQVTGSAEALAKARRAYRAICQVYDLSQAHSEGYFCKPWGWKCQPETSSDQFVYAMMGLDAFYPLATAEEQARIADMIPKMARWWISRKYVWQYLGKPFNWPKCRFPTFAALGEKYAKNGEFAAELKRLLADPAVTNDYPFCCSVTSRPWKAPSGKTYYSLSPGTVEIGFNAISSVLESDPQNAYGRRVMDACHELATTCIQPDGTSLRFVGRADDGSWREMPPSETTIEPPSKTDTRYNSLASRFVGPTRTSAIGAVQGMILMSRYNAAAKAWVEANAEKLLKATASENLCTDPHGVRPKELTELLSHGFPHSEDLVAWLHAYWAWRALCKPTRAHLILAGDSTLQVRPPEKPQGSWGIAASSRIKCDVALVDLAVGGRSTRTYRDVWETNVLTRIKSGDWVIIQFGHNDMSKDSDPKAPRRETDPQTEYKDNLRRFVSEVRAKGATPVLVTPISLYLWQKDGSWPEKDPLDRWVTAMREVAAETKTPLVDLHAPMVRDIRAIGREASMKWFMYSENGRDWAHPTKYGARMIAKLFWEELRRTKSPLAACFDLAGLSPYRTPDGWTLTSDAEELMATLREQAKAYRPHNRHVGIFPRGQLKYGEHRADFIHKWYDRPLMQDSSFSKEFANEAGAGRLLYPAAWKKTAECVRMGRFDGLATSILKSGRSEIIEMSRIPGGEMQVWVEMPYGMYDKGFSTYHACAEKARTMPNAYRVDGKILLTRYPVVGDDKLDECEKFRKELEAKYPGEFAVIFYTRAFEPRLPNGPIDAAFIEATREHVRLCLRKMDGVLVGDGDHFFGRRYNPDFFRNFTVPIYQSVLAEPEFAGKKYLIGAVVCGHENCYRWNMYQDSQGTYTLAETLKSVRALRPECVIATEWDEENENTCFRPTIANGIVHPRLVRAASDALDGREPSPMPGDDVTVPNLVVSYRKMLAAGDPIEVEVRNIPDGTFPGETFACTLVWKNLAGETVKTYAEQKIASDSETSFFFTSRASELAGANRVLVPEFKVRGVKGGGAWTYGGDFWPLGLHATRALDSKWMKHALRDRAKGVTGSLALSPADATGARTVTCRFDSPRNVRSVEVLEGPETIYMYDPATTARTDCVLLRFRLQQALERLSSKSITGAIRFTGTTPTIKTKGNRGVAACRDGWTFKDRVLKHFYIELFAEVPTNDLATAEIAIDLPPFPQTTLRVKDVVEKGIYGLSGPASANLVVSAPEGTLAIPHPCNVTSGAFSFTFHPADPTSVLRLQIVDADYHVWCGSPQVLAAPTGNLRTIRVVEHFEDGATTVKVDESRFVEPAYDFNDSCGAIVSSPLGRAFRGVFSGPVGSLATYFGEGESCYGDTIERYLRNLDFGRSHAPTRVGGPDGSTALAFDGHNYVMLPMQLAPQYAGFAIDLDICPADANGTQTLVDAGNAAYTLFLKDGVASASLWGLRPPVRGPAVKPGVWQHIRLVYDTSKVWVEVDGVAGEKRAHCVCQHAPRYTAVGAANRHPDFYRGKLANLKFSILP